MSVTTENGHFDSAFKNKQELCLLLCTCNGSRTRQFKEEFQSRNVFLSMHVNSATKIYAKLFKPRFNSGNSVIAGKMYTVFYETFAICPLLMSFLLSH